MDFIFFSTYDWIIEFLSDQGKIIPEALEK